MIKVYCNKCRRELATDNRRIVMAISPISCYGEIKIDFCDSCLREIIGEDEYCKLKELEERKRKIEERKGKRGKNNV